MEALTSLVKCNMSAEVFRSLALFITYAYHPSTNTASRTPNKGQAAAVPPRAGTLSSGTKRPIIATNSEVKDSNSTIMTKRSLGNKVLEMYTGFLCEKGNTSNIKKFARTVTNKVFR